MSRDILYAGLAFPDSFHIAKGSTESTAKIQIEIFNTKRIGRFAESLHQPYSAHPQGDSG